MAGWRRTRTGLLRCGTQVGGFLQPQCDIPELSRPIPPSLTCPALSHALLPQKLEVAEQQHRRLSSKEAVAAREANAALSQLPRTFSRLQRIFGNQVRFPGWWQQRLWCLEWAARDERAVQPGG